MSNRTLKWTALGVVAIHFVVVLLHSNAHQVLPVEATPAQLAFISDFSATSGSERAE